MKYERILYYTIIRYTTIILLLSITAINWFAKMMNLRRKDRYKTVFFFLFDYKILYKIKYIFIHPWWNLHINDCFNLILFIIIIYSNHFIIILPLKKMRKNIDDFIIKSSSLFYHRIRKLFERWQSGFLVIGRCSFPHESNHGYG